jgi:Ca-activated chloride channel family protein
MNRIEADSLSVATGPAPVTPAQTPPPVVNFELGVAEEAKKAETGADRNAPQEPALLPASEVTALYSQLNPGQATQTGDLGQIQYSTVADDRDTDGIPDLSRTTFDVDSAPVLGLGAVPGKEVGAKRDDASADAVTIPHYAAATAVDPFAARAAGAEFRATVDPFAAEGAEYSAKEPAAKDVAAKRESLARSVRNTEDRKRKEQSQRELAALTPETAARRLVEEKDNLAPAEKERLAEVVRERQVATLTQQERPLSEEELAAPPAAPSPVNPFVMTDKDRLSTFALEADTASYALARRYLANRRLPPAGLIRMEEFVNAFDYNYPVQNTRTFAIHAEAGPAPFGKELTLLKIGVKAKVLGRDGRKPAHLVFVIDASGSMGREDRLPLVQVALGLMVTQLDPRDRLSLVTYDTQARLLLEAVPAARAAEIQAAVGALSTGATTNLLAGVELGYQIAARHFRSGETNRVILCSDGVANVGPADAAAILGKVDQYRRQGIALTSVGVGSGSYDDRMLEQLANQGDGNYVFVDSPEQARRVFVDDFAGTLQMVARNAKIQVEFNPLRVRRYRLVGYENRDVADQDFRNDAVDAGEIGSGQAATALYELELLPVAGDAAVPPDLGTVYVRYENVDSGRVEEISSRLSTLILQDRAPERDPRFFLAACAAEFAEILRQSEHARDGSLQALESNTTRVANALPLDQRAQELLTLVRRAEGLPR